MFVGWVKGRASGL